MRRTLLLDGDIFVYASASAVEYECQWTEDLWTLHSHLNDAIAHMDDKITELKKALNADEVVLAFSDQANFRKAVLPTYKHNRKALRKPIVFKPLMQYAEETYRTYRFARLEGDDVLGILSTGDLIKGEKIIVSLDKDMKGVPGLLFNDGKYRQFRDPGDDAEDWVLPYSTAQANEFHLFQTLTGDTTDGYGGCPGMGPVKANRLFEQVVLDEHFEANAWTAIVAAYVKAGLSEEVALQMARVARILRAEDYNIKTGEIKLWLPASLATRITAPASTVKSTPPRASRSHATVSAAERSPERDPYLQPGRSKSKTTKASSTAKGSSKS